MNLELVGSRLTHARSTADEQELLERPPIPASGPRVIQKRFVILATPRTGSSHLVELLNSHPQASCLGELFNPKGTVLRELGMRNKKVMTEVGQTPLEFLDRVIEQLEEREGCKPCFGFKMMLHHDPRMIDYVLDDPGWTVIVLERENLLGQWTSMALAKKTGRWDTGGGKGKGKLSDKSGDDDEDEEGDDDVVRTDSADSAPATDAPAPPVYKVTFDAWKFEQYCFRMRARYASIYHRLGQRKYFRLTTEEMDARHSELLEFLGLDPGPIRATRPRQNSTSMRDRIENYDTYARYAKRHSIPVS